MYSFDGKHRQKPVVSLGGVSKKESKSSFMEKRLIERQQRQTARSEIAACLKIQKFIRGSLCRKRQARRFRLIFEEEFAILKQKDARNELTFDDTRNALRMMGFFFNIANDHERLVKLCQLVLKLHNARKLNIQGDERSWMHQFKILLHLCLRALEDSSDPKIPITVPLRMLEVFMRVYLEPADPRQPATSSSRMIILYLIKQGYFRCLRALINNKVPSSLEMSLKPPTPLAASVKYMILRPMESITVHPSADHEMQKARDAVLQSFAKEILCPEMSDQIFLFLVPSLSMEISLVDLLNSLLKSSICETKFSKTTQSLQVDTSPWLLYSLLTFGEKQIGKLSLEDLLKYVVVIQKIIHSLPTARDLISNERMRTNSDSDSDSEEMEIEAESFPEDPNLGRIAFLREKCMELLDSPNHVKELVSLVENQSLRHDAAFQTHKPRNFDDCIKALCRVSYVLLTKHKMVLHKTRLLQRLSFSRLFMRGCWHILSTMTTCTGIGKDVLVLNQLARGSSMSADEQQNIIPVIYVFCLMFRHALFCIYDTDFYSSSAGKAQAMMPFNLDELVDMSRVLLDVSIGLIQMMFSETRSNVVDAYGKAMLSVGARPLGDSQGLDSWSSTCQCMTSLIRQLHSRDSRHQFCPEGHWLSSRIAINAEQVTIEGFFEEEDQDEDRFKVGMSALTARSIAILRHIPFSVPFLQRVKIFQRILNQDKDESHEPAADFMSPNASSLITVNRKYLYQDAYDQLSQERAPDIKKKIRVKMINAQGLDEAGIDGGGIFREFMAQLVKQGFDPSYGYFKITSEQLLYPNPHAAKIIPDCLKHFHFLGRILGKIIYENMMVELPFAPFFLCKLLNKQSADVDIHHLESLDPELYRNLLSLKNYEGDFDDFALNFTAMNGEFGNVEVEDLKPGGRDIPVTSLNRIEYIHLMADYRLNKQIRHQCNAFRAGLSDVINIEWLQMFDHRELQVLISGAPVPVDLDDLRSNTNYSGGYSDDNDYIEALWSILQEFNNTQRRKFLKFVTSCSRPPLLGFKAAKIIPDCLKHFHFLGRILGKIIYENMMVELPFAPFFLCKLLNKQSADVDIHHLESLDPELYRNLLSLKNYEGDFDDFALNFTAMNGEFGNVEVEDLKPGGRDIPVTSLNRIEYIHLMADYRLNKQIRHQCNAFRAGLSDVINIEWLQMFDHRELQVLISGAPVPVDLDDLRSNTNYSGGYSDDNDYIEALWSILQEFNNTQRRKFLKFVTSCSRPPLLGFKELEPKICIHFGGNEDRLPSASTCMNILKLPQYKTKEILQMRLLYAIESEAGFELS